MKELSQERAPIYEALERFNKMRVVPFDVPGHKRGRGNPELTRLLGESCIRLDVNSMKPLDNLCHPVSVIREAEDLAGGGFSCIPCLSDGGRDDLRSAEHDPFRHAKRGKNHPSEKCTPKRYGSHGTERSNSRLCKSGRK